MPVFDRGAGWTSSVPTLNKASIVGCRCVLVCVEGEGAGVSEHLQSACAGEGSVGQRWLVGEKLEMGK